MVWLEPGGNGSQQRTLRDTLRSLDLRIVPLDPDDLEGFIGNALFLPGSSAVVLPDSTASSMRRTLEGLGFERREKLKAKGQAAAAGGDWSGWLAMFLRAQRKVERRHRRSRVDLMVYEKQRQEVLKDLGADPYVD